MAADALLQKALEWATTGNGAYFILACAAGAILLPSRQRSMPLKLPLHLLTRVAFLAYAGLALAYFLFPNYSDHAGPAMTGLGMKLLAGRPVYPALDDYSFHGLLYGPLVAEIQAAAIFLGSTLGGLPVMLASKLPGLVSFVVASALIFRMARGRNFGALYYTLFLLPFQILAFWNRCEPELLLLVAAGFWSVEALPRRRALLAIGLCAGLASGMKLHGCLYIAPAAIAFLSRHRFSADVVWLPLLAAAGAFLLVFLPAGVSMPAFFDYLLLASGHGLSARIFLFNLVFMAALWSPLVVALAADGRVRELLRPSLLALAALQVAVALVGSKPGAGLHHLLPFIPANALLFARYAEPGPRTVNVATLTVWLAVFLPGLYTCVQQGLGMAANWRAFETAQRELLLIKQTFPGTVMGLAGRETFPLVYLRPLLETRDSPQVEYSSYMDLRLAGVSDRPLRDALDGCRIGHLAVPIGEPPFSMASIYTPATPLFSDDLRDTFRRRFASVARGNWYEVFKCAPAAG